MDNNIPTLQDSVEQKSQTAAELRRIAIIQSMYTLMNICHGDNYRAGWWNDLETGQDLTFSYNEAFAKRYLNHSQRMVLSEKLNLVTSELSEGLEAYRKYLYDDKLVDTTGFECEIIDAIVRLFDLLGGLKMESAPITMFRKLQYNCERADHKPENRRKSSGKLF